MSPPSLDDLARATKQPSTGYGRWTSISKAETNELSEAGSQRARRYEYIMLFTADELSASRSSEDETIELESRSSLISRIEAYRRRLISKG